MRKYLYFTVIALIFTVYFNVNAAGSLKPSDNFYVTDNAGVLTDSQVNDMLTRGEQLREANGVQVVAVIVNNYIGGSIEEYANSIFNDWKLGSKGDNNGILLLVAVDDGDVRIEVGDGLSGQLPDSRTGQILDDFFMEPAENGDLGTAVYDTYLELIKNGSRLSTKGATPVAGNSYSSANSASANTANNTFSPFNAIFSLFRMLIIIILIIMVLVFIASISRRTVYRAPRRGFGGWGWGMGRQHRPHHPPTGRPRGGFTPPPPSSGGSSPRKTTINLGGGGRSSGSGASRSFNSGSSRGFSGGKSSGGFSSGGGGRSSGGGASRSFKK